MEIPHHIAIIPDGNRRWARERNLPTFEGHRRGFDSLVKVCRKSRKLGVKIMTVWAFSTENWKRTKKEVGYLMKLYEVMISSFLNEAINDHIRIVHLGRKDRINANLKNKIIDAENKTKHFKKYYLCIALDYGGRDEILRAVKQNKILNETDLNAALDTASLPFPDPDLIIRTGGEMRLSGFMSWQNQYSELMFSEKYLPDFSPQDLTDSIKKFSDRKRRFGK